MSTTRFPLVAVVGAGQLARMLAPPAVALGVRLRVLATDPGESAAQVVPDVVLGGADDAAALAALAAGADVVTLDHEQVPADLLRALEPGSGSAPGVPVRPGPDALAHAQDKLRLRSRLAELGVAGPAWARVTDADELAAFADRVGWPVVLKTPTGGYDGKGVLVVEGRDDLDPSRAGRPSTAASWFARARARAGDGAGGEGALLAEEHVDFVRELAVLVARSPSGQAAAWPVVETVQVEGVCREVIAPAPGLDPDLAATATAMALGLAEALGVTGVMAVEAFETRERSRRPAESRVLVNELAMRPHNSGHWTIDGSTTSQFEQHLRAVLDLPLGAVTPRARWCVMANVLGSATPERDGHSDLFRANLHVMAHDPAVKVHLYGKEVRPGRKVGHVTAWGDDLADVRARARHAADFITGTIDE